ncbi:MAG: DUF4166 domain-containing protein [Pseudomonadota bacterium]
MTLYEKILGADFESLPTPVRNFHARREEHRYTGRAIVERGRNPISRIVCAIIGFPKPGDGVPVEVTIVPTPQGEQWTRNFAGKRFSSFQAAGSGPNDGLIVESFGPVRVALALKVDDNKLRLLPERWSAFGVPLPPFLLPGGDTFETQKDNVFHFHVEITAPLIGLIVSYEGTLTPV